MYTVSLINMKGGVGKTTTSVNVATGLSMLGKPTLLADLDPQSNTTSIYCADTPAATTSTLFKGETTIEETIIDVGGNLWLVPSELFLANTETELRMQTHAPQHNRFQKALEAVGDRYEYCIVDCPPIINLLTINAIMASDLVIVPIKPDRFALQGFSVTVRNIQQIRENWELDIDYKVLFTIVNRNIEEREMISQMRELLKDRVYETQIRSQPKPVAAASSLGRAVIREQHPRIGVAEDYRSLVKEITGERNGR